MMDDTPDNRSDADQLYDALEHVIKVDFAHLTTFQTIGCIEALKADLLDQLPKR